MTEFPTLSYVAFAAHVTIRLGSKHRQLKNLSEERKEEIIDLCESYIEESTEDRYKDLLELVEPIKIVENNDHFKVDSAGRVFLKGTSIPMPDALANKVLKCHENNKSVDALINFWQLCLLNTNKTARDGFFEYISQYGIIITERGYALLYKAVNKEAPSVQGLDEFVSQKHTALKDQGYEPANFQVFRGRGSGKLMTSTPGGLLPNAQEELEELGNLESLYVELFQESEEEDEKTEFLPQRTGKYGQSIVIGEPVSMPREECDPDITRGCSYGLHVGSYDYVYKFGRSMDTILAVLVNPADVVALPQHDNSKIRVCQYFPYSVISREEDGHWEELESEFFEDEFIPYEKERIETMLNTFEGRGEDGQFIGNERANEIESRYEDLDKDEIQNILKNRLVSID